MYIALILLIAYLAFIVLPAQFVYLFICGRVRRETVEKALACPARAPYRDALSADIASFQALKGESVTIKSGKLDLASTYIDNGGKYIALLSHGYHSQPSVIFALYAKILLARGYDLLVIDQRGQGASGGRCTMGVCEGDDLLAWCDYIDKNIRKPILVVGISMGSTAAMSVADKYGKTVMGALYDCGFVSAYNQMKLECTRRHLPGFALMHVVRLCFAVQYQRDCKKGVLPALSHSAVPALFVHGTDDIIVPMRDGVRAYNACSSTKDVIISLGAGHTMALNVGGNDALSQLNDFLDKTEVTICKTLS